MSPFPGGYLTQDEADARRAVDASDVVRFLAIFLGEDPRFDVAVGGNPIAVDKMLAEAREALDRARSGRVEE